MSLSPISAKIFLGNKVIWRGYLAACPRVGDTLRYGESDTYVKVTEVIWCINEQADGQPQHKTLRVNIRTEISP